MFTALIPCKSVSERATHQMVRHNVSETCSRFGRRNDLDAESLPNIGPTRTWLVVCPEKNSRPQRHKNRIAKNRNDHGGRKRARNHSTAEIVGFFALPAAKNR